MKTHILGVQKQALAFTKNPAFLPHKMYLAKLITALQSFNEPHFRALREYVHSPYFKVPTSSIALFDYLVPLYPDFIEKKVNAESISEVAKNLSTPAKQARAGSELLESVEEFIALQQWEKNKRGKSLSTLQGLRELGLSVQFTKLYEAEMEDLQNCPEQDLDTFLNRYLLTELSFVGFDAKLNRTSQNDINPLLQSFEEYVALKKLRYLCEAISRKQVFGTNFDKASVATLLKTLAPITNEHYPYVYLFVNAYQMIDVASYEDSIQYYQLIKNFAAKGNFEKSPASLREVAAYTINYSLNWFNKGHEEAGAEYLWWMEWKMKHDILLEKDKLQPITFRNIVTIAVITKKDPGWINEVISTYAQYLPHEQYETNLAFAKGLHQYALKKHVEAIRHFMLAQAKEDAIFNSIIRRWQWMSLYESDPEDTSILFNQLEAFDKHLQRYKKELLHVVPVFSVFIGYALKLLRANAGEAGKILEGIKQKENFPGRDWLAEQLKVKLSHQKKPGK